jgi:hypothetical protein
MDREVKLQGGRTGSMMLHHPLGATIGAVVVAAPCTWIAQGAEGTAAAALVGLVGLVLGAPLGAMLADSASDRPH